MNNHAKQSNRDLLDEFTDLLTSDIKDTEESVADQQKYQTYSSSNSINFGKQSSSRCTMVSMSNTTPSTSNHSSFTADPLNTVTPTRTSPHSDEATINTSHENEYVNLPCISVKKPSVPPRPTPRRKYLLEETEPIMSVTTAKERERFEKTINKALTSLPKLPKSLPNEKEKMVFNISTN